MAKPTHNAYVESFNGKFRDECLNESWFVSLEHAKAAISTWRRDYNEVRPHNSLAQLTPSACTDPVIFCAGITSRGNTR